MPHHTHDMGLPSFLIDRIAHGFAVDGEPLILLSIVGIPPGKCAVECNGIDPDEDVADSAFAGNNPDHATLECRSV